MNACPGGTSHCALRSMSAICWPCSLRYCSTAKCGPKWPPTYANAQAPSLVARLMSTDAGYIPLPQRLLALLFHAPGATRLQHSIRLQLDRDPAHRGHGGELLPGPFRRVVQSDGLRLLVALSVLALADYETRTFINFTYFAAFFILILSALALVSDKMDAPPGWAWLTPVLMISKPAVGDIARPAAGRDIGKRPALSMACGSIRGRLLRAGGADAA